MEITKETVEVMKETLIVVINETMRETTEKNRNERLVENIDNFCFMLNKKLNLDGFMIVGFLSLFGDIKRRYEKFTISGFYSEENSSYVIDVDVKDSGLCNVFAIRWNEVVEL